MDDDHRADTAAGGGVAALPPPRTEATDAGAPEMAAADAESLQPSGLALQPLPPPPREQRRDDDAGKDGEEIVNRRRSRWSCVRPPVLWLLSLFRLRREKQSQAINQPKVPLPPPEEEVPDKTATVKKDRGRGNKRRREEPPMAPASGSTPSLAPMTKKLQNAGRLVMKTLSWYCRHRSPEKPAAAQKGVVETKPSTSRREEETSWAAQNLDKILEDACTRLVAAELRYLREKTTRQCLLTSFVFDLGAEVKKQAMTYWWATQFRLSPGGAADIFSALSLDGYLEPVKNRCSGVIHGCRVNPLVHWMVKKQARNCNVAGREDGGEQVVDRILCLTTDNRDLLQKIGKVDEFVAQDQFKKRPTKKGRDRFKKSPTKKAQGRLKKTVQEPPQSEGSPPHKSAEDVEITERKNKESVEAAESLSMWDEKRIIVNISAHVYKLPEALLTNLADRLEVLQLGGWRSSDDDTYMEVHALESLDAIGKLQNLRYLGLRGVSRLTELPAKVRQLRQLTILDVRGCQNLVRVSSAAVKTLTRLTHLDLTECYMLEHVGRGVAALSELQVFKGFVFSVGKQRGDECRVQDLARLRKLRKLSVNVTTDAFVNKGDMAALGKLAALASLTVTWGEPPSVLLDGKGEKRLETLLERWTDLQLPRGLEKLDVRCYPKRVLPEKWFQGRERLKKLYVRGGEVEELQIPRENRITILRLRYLNEFKMTWLDLLAKLDGQTRTIERVEVVDMDLKVMRNETKDGAAPPPRRREGKDGKEVEPMKKRMCIPELTLDGVGVWVRDVKEEENGTREKARDTAVKEEQGDRTEGSGVQVKDEKITPATEGGAKEEENGRYKKGRDDTVMKEEKGDRTEGSGVQAKDDKITASSPAAAIEGGAKEEENGRYEKGHDGMVMKEEKDDMTEGSGVQEKDDKITALTPATEGGAKEEKNSRYENDHDTVKAEQGDKTEVSGVQVNDGKIIASSRAPATEEGGAKEEENGRYEKDHDTVKAEQGDKTKVSGVQVNDGKIIASSRAPATGGDGRKGSYISESPIPRESPQAPAAMAPTSKAETAGSGGADVPKAAGKSRQEDDDGSTTGKTGSEAEDKAAAEEDGGDAGAAREVAGGDADVARMGPVVSAENEVENELVAKFLTRPVDQREDGGCAGGDTNTAGSMITPAARPPKLGIETVPAASVPEPAAMIGSTDYAVPQDQVGVNPPDLMKN